MAQAAAAAERLYLGINNGNPEAILESMTEHFVGAGQPRYAS